MALKVSQNGDTAQFKVEYDDGKDSIRAIISVPSHPFPDSISIEDRKKTAAKRAGELAQLMIDNIE